MKDFAWAPALMILVALNYWGGRAWRPLLARATFLVTILPALALIGWTGSKFGYVLLNEEEVNRRYREEGDLTYFMVDMAFGISLGIGGLWIVVAWIGFYCGRRDRALSGK